MMSSTKNKIQKIGEINNKSFLTILFATAGLIALHFFFSQELIEIFKNTTNPIAESIVLSISHASGEHVMSNVFLILISVLYLLFTPLKSYISTAIIFGLITNILFILWLDIFAGEVGLGSSVLSSFMIVLPVVHIYNSVDGNMTDKTSIFSFTLFFVGSVFILEQVVLFSVKTLLTDTIAYSQLGHITGIVGGFIYIVYLYKLSPENVTKQKPFNYVK